MDTLEELTVHGVRNPVDTHRELMTVLEDATGSLVVLGDRIDHGIVQFAPLLQLIVSTDGQAVLVKQCGPQSKGEGNA